MSLTTELDLQRAAITDSPPSTNPLITQLQQILNTCSQSITAEDSQTSINAVTPLLDFLNSLHETTESDPNEASIQVAIDVLTEIIRYISSPSLDQVVVNELLFELPKSVSKFAGIAEKCCQIAECVIDRLVSICNPRDMITVLCEALDSSTEMFQQPAYFVPLFSGISKVFLCMQRRQYEQITVAMPIILNVLKGVSSTFEDEDKDSFNGFIDRAINIATSIQEVCQKLEGKRKEQIRAILGLFVLQIMALVSSRLADQCLSCIAAVSQLSHFLPFCNMSYLGLITGSDVETFTTLVLEVDSDDYMKGFSFVKHGASLAVIWGHISDEVVKAAEEDMTVLKDNLRRSQSKRWQAVGMLTHVLSSIYQPWELKKHTIGFLLYIMEENISERCNDSCADCSSYVTSLFSAVQVMQSVIIYTSDTMLRRDAFAALKRVLADIPVHQRFDILKASITINNNNPSMIAILIGLVKEEIILENSKQRSQSNDQIKLEEEKTCPRSPFWSGDVLELLELILKPPKGGPPSLPDQSDAVLSALNLYRFLLITESTGKTNFTGVLSEDTLRKVHREWLLPLRILVTSTISETRKDSGQVAVDIVCGLNPIELVLYRCIELVEEKLQPCA